MDTDEPVSTSGILILKSCAKGQNKIGEAKIKYTQEPFEY